MRIDIFKIWRGQNKPPTNEGYLEIPPDTDPSWHKHKCRECGWLGIKTQVEVYVPYKTDCVEDGRNKDYANICRHSNCQTVRGDPACPAFIQRTAPEDGKDGDD